MGVQGAPNPLIYTANLNLRLNFARERYFYDFYGEPAQERFLALARSELRYS